MHELCYMLMKYLNSTGTYWDKYHSVTALKYYVHNDHQKQDVMLEGPLSDSVLLLLHYFYKGAMLQ